MLHPDDGIGFRRKVREPLRLGVTPLIDIVFLLLIFFMLTSRFVVQEGIMVDLPQTVKSHELPGLEIHIIYLKKDGTINYEGRDLEPAALRRVLSGFTHKERLKPFEVRSDRKSSVQSMVSVLEILRDTGVVNVTVGTIHAFETVEK
jgi:biopolymer transport protein ExbD